MRKLGLFQQFSSIGREDLIQEALTAIYRAKGFDPERGTFSTWASVVVGRRLIDIWRAEARKATKQGVYASLLPTEEDGDEGLRLMLEQEAGADAPDPLPLVEWLSTIYRGVRRALGSNPRHRRGRRFFNVGQSVAVAMLMERHAISIRGARLWFAESPPMSEAVRFRHLPSHGWFQGVSDVCTDIFRRLRPEQKGQFRALLEWPLTVQRITVCA